MIGSAAPCGLSLSALSGMPMVVAGDDLAAMIVTALAASGETLQPDDLVVVTQKIVSKAEGRQVALASVTPSPRAREIAGVAAKDPRLVELILSESTEVMRVRPGVIIVRHRLGMVLANAGIDQSNVDQDGAGIVLLLPENPDRSCAELREKLRLTTGVPVATLIIDSIGRAWRNGTVGAAIGVSGMPGLLNLRGRPDLFNRGLQTTEVGLADEAAAAASLLMGQAAESRPVVIIRGLSLDRRDGSAAELLRPRHLDMFL